MGMEKEKAYLLQIERCNSTIESKLYELAKAESLAYKITSTLKEVASFGSGGQDKVGDAVARLNKAREELKTAIVECEIIKAEVEATIEKVTNENQYKILRKRYVEGKTLANAADEFPMTYRNACYIHGRALQTISRILNERENDNGNDNGSRP